MQTRWATLVNIVVPGAGLIGLRREWLGVAVAILFCVLAEIALLGWLLMPAVIPGWVSAGALVAATAVWGWSQWLLARWVRLSCGQAAERQLAGLLRRADEARAAAQLDEAADLVRAALRMNDEHVEGLRRWAELMTQTGQRAEAARAWRRVLQLNQDADVRREARAALEELDASV